MATEKDFRVKSSIIAPTSLQVGSATITSSGSAVVLPANSTMDDGAGGSVNIGSPDLTGYATESYVTTALTSYATTAQLSSKANSADLSTVALTGNYNDLSNTPSLFSGSYTDLTNKPTIPTLTSDLANDSGFITSSSIPTNVSSFTNDSGYLTSYTETDPIYTASSWYTTTNNSSNWNTAYGWGNHASAGYAQLSASSNNFTGNIQIDGDLTVSGTQNIINTTDLAVEDNMIYLNSTSTVANPDLGFAGNYNDGTYAHTGLFRDASDGRWKFYDSYIPEPDASAFIDTTHGSFNLATVQAGAFIGDGSGLTGVVKTVDIGSTVQAYDADTTKNDVANTFTANQTINGDLTVDTNTLYVDSTNNRVGIGMSSPTYKLQIFTGSLGTTSGDKLGTLSLYTTTTNEDTLNFTKIREADGEGWTTAAWRIQQRIDATDMGYIQFNGSGNANGLLLGTNNTERMRIDSTGNVGIGTESPSYKLDVSGQTRSTSYLETVYAVSGTTPVLSETNGNIQTWTLSGNSTPTGGPAAGASITLMIDDGTAYTITWTSVVDQWIGGSAPTLATTGYTVVELWTVGATTYGAYVGDAS